MELSSYHEMVQDGIYPEYREDFFVADVNLFYTQLAHDERQMYRHVYNHWQEYLRAIHGKRKMPKDARKLYPDPKKEKGDNIGY